MERRNGSPLPSSGRGRRPRAKLHNETMIYSGLMISLCLVVFGQSDVGVHPNLSCGGCSILPPILMGMMSMPRRYCKLQSARLAVKSNGAGKHKTHGLAVMSIAQKEAMFESAIVNMVEVVKSNECAVISLSEELPREEALALFVYQNYFWMKNRNAVYDKLSGEAVLRVAADNWKSFNDSDKAPYVAKARASEILVAELEEYKKTRKLTQAMMNLKM